MSVCPLEPLDIGICRIKPQSLYQHAMVWALDSPFTHVLLYLGELAIPGRQLLYESVGRGIVLSPPAAYYGREMVWVRPQMSPIVRDHVLRAALDLLCSGESFYDYVQGGKAGLSLILQRLHLPVPLSYQRDGLYICSEAVAEPFWRSGVPILPPDRCPLPADFMCSPLARLVGWDIFSPEWLPVGGTYLSY